MTATDDSTGSNIDRLQFHLFGEKPSTGNYSDIVNKDMDLLLSLGGLVRQRVITEYPNGGSATLDFANLQSIILSLRQWCQEQVRYRWEPSESVASGEVARELLKLFAGPLAAKAVPLLPDFAEFLSKSRVAPEPVEHTGGRIDVAPPLVWSKTLTCTFLVYLQKNKKGEYVDTGEIALRSIEMSLQDAKYKYKYDEVNYLVDVKLIRKGGHDHDALQLLLQANSVQQFMSAKNFFNAKLI